MEKLKVDLNKLSFEETFVSFLDSSFEIEELDFDISSEKIETKVKLKNLEIDQLINYPLDFFKANLIIKETEWDIKSFILKSMLDEFRISGRIKELEKGNQIEIKGNYNGDTRFLNKVKALRGLSIRGSLSSDFKVFGELDNISAEVSFKSGKITNDYYPINESNGFLILKKSFVIKSLNINNDEIKIKNQVLGNLGNLKKSFKNLEPR